MSTDTSIMSVAEREELWSDFLKRWPLEKLSTMSLTEYNQAGENDHFCRWLEKHTEALGSIWGGSSLKFGVYSRSSTATKEPTAQSGVSQDGRYGWYSKYGPTAEEAFSTVRALIVQAANAARAGRLDEVEDIDLWPIIRRKIAFLYQDREHPCVLPIFMSRLLKQAWPVGSEAPKDVVALYQGLLAQRGDKPLLTYCDELLARIPKGGTDPDDEVLQHFAAASTLLEALDRQGTTAAFAELARGLHEKGLDWWITKAEMVHAGRTEHPEIWSAAVALRINVSNGVVGLRAGDSDGEEARPLTLDSVATWVDQVAADPRIQPAAHRQPYWPDDYGTGEDRLSVALTEASIRNGQIKVSKLQRLFPAAHFCATTERPAQPFVLDLPDGTRLDEAWVLNDRQRIQPKMGALMKAQQLRPGDHAVLTKVGPGHYALAFAKQGSTLPPHPPLPQHVIQPLNQILYGPPGTGKTYATVDASLKVLDPDFYEAHRGDSQVHRSALKVRFDALAREGRVRFVTFHQSFSYEDFVEGIRAHVSDNGDCPTDALAYTIERGVFAELCSDALRDREHEKDLGVRDGATIWKISLSEASSTDGTREFCLDHNEARIGWEMVGDLRKVNLDDPALGLGINDRNSLAGFGHEMQVGDVVLCFKTLSTIRAVGVVAGEYEHQTQVPAGVASGYVHKRAVRWLAKDLDLDIVALNGGKHLTQPTVYPLKRMEWPALLSALRAARVPFAQRRTAAANPYVLVIDEINRGNISRIFGELITLIEPSKRAGASEALEVVLPYSKKRFSVPDNVYLIGTMNTADRSLTSMDVALRRRFVFTLMPPQPRLLAGVSVEGIPVDELLEVMNQRIEALLDRDHCLGHAYFMPLREKPELGVLRGIFMNQVLPLLQEYFFDDWQRIQWVLNDHRKPRTCQFVQSTDLNTHALFGDDVNVTRAPQLWSINHGAFDLVESYLGVIDHQLAQEDE